MEDINGNEIEQIGHCGTSCVKCLHHIKYCSVTFFFFIYFRWVISDKCLQRKGSYEMYQTAADWTELLVTGLWRGDVCVCLFVCLLHCINSDKYVLSNESHAMYQTSGYFRIVMISQHNVIKHLFIYFIFIPIDTVTDCYTGVASSF